MKEGRMDWDPTVHAHTIVLRSEEDCIRIEYGEVFQRTSLVAPKWWIRSIARSLPKYHDRMVRRAMKSKERVRRLNAERSEP